MPDGGSEGGFSGGARHVVVDETWAAQVGPPDAEEAALSDGAPGARRQDLSRLSCQIKASVALYGSVLHLPAA